MANHPTEWYRAAYRRDYGPSSSKNMRVWPEPTCTYAWTISRPASTLQTCHAVQSPADAAIGERDWPSWLYRSLRADSTPARVVRVKAGASLIRLGSRKNAETASSILEAGNMMRRMLYHLKTGSTGLRSELYLRCSTAVLGVLHGREA